DSRHGLVGSLEALGGAFQPQPPNVLHDRFAHHAAEDAVKMERGEMGNAGEVVETDGLIEVRLNEVQGSQDSLVVGLAGFGSHEDLSPKDDANRRVLAPAFPGLVRESSVNPRR